MDDNMTGKANDNDVPESAQSTSKSSSVSSSPDAITAATTKVAAVKESGSSLTFKDFRNRERPERTKYKKKSTSTTTKKSTDTLVDNYFKQDYGLKSLTSSPTTKSSNDNQQHEEQNDANTNNKEIDDHRRTVSQMRKDLRESQMKEKELQQELQELETKKKEASQVTQSHTTRRTKLQGELKSSKATAVEYQLKASELSVSLATQKANIDEIQDSLKFQQQENVKKTMENVKKQKNNLYTSRGGIFGIGYSRSSNTSSSSTNKAAPPAKPPSNSLDAFLSRGGDNDSDGDAVVEDDDISTDFPTSFSVDHHHSTAGGTGTAKSSTNRGGVFQNSLRKLQTSRQEAEITRLTRRVDTLTVETEKYPEEISSLESEYEKALKVNEEMRAKLDALEQRYGALHVAE